MDFYLIAVESCGVIGRDTDACSVRLGHFATLATGASIAKLIFFGIMCQQSVKMSNLLHKLVAQSHEWGFLFYP